MRRRSAQRICKTAGVSSGDNPTFLHQPSQRLVLFPPGEIKSGTNLFWAGLADQCQVLNYAKVMGMHGPIRSGQGNGGRISWGHFHDPLSIPERNGLAQQSANSSHSLPFGQLVDICESGACLHMFRRSSVFLPDRGPPEGRSFPPVPPWRVPSGCRVTA